MGALIVNDEALKLISAKLDKYEKLIWFARSRPPESAEWDNVPADIKHGALNAQAKVKEFYPDEVDELRCPFHADYSHGFNSGMVAALRYVMTAAEDPKTAEEWFPELDS